jgi:hypothetical protein
MDPLDTHAHMQTGTYVHKVVELEWRSIEEANVAVLGGRGHTEGAVVL